MNVIKKLKLLSMVLINVLVIAVGFGFVASTIVLEQAGTINNALGYIWSERIQLEETDPNADYIYYKTGYKNLEELIDAAQTKAEQIVAEGSALLKNTGNALPLEKGSSVSLFSVSSVDPVYCGTGSSATVTGREVSFKDGFEKDDNMSVNPTLWKWYQDNYNTYKKEGPTSITSQAATYGVVDATWAQITSSAKTDSAYGDAAIFILSRLGGESDDMIWNNSSGEGGTKGILSNGNYLELSPREKDVLTNLKAEKEKGTFKKVIVVMNSANPVQCDFANDAAYGIDALVWCGNLGETGAEAVGDLLVGNVNFSGKLSNTFFTKHAYNPVYANWQPKTYSGTAMPSQGNYYVVYQEGIYNGYRYTETRYEDVVMGRANVGTFNYDEVVAYPFGFGLSYTTFEYGKPDVTFDAAKDLYTVKVNVKNTGTVAGKEAVQLYVQKPYTQYDETNGVEKSAVDLIGFAKTDILEPGKDETVTITVAGRDFASYDSYKAKTFILDQGDYYLTTAKDAHSAIKNILEAKSKAVGGNKDHVYKKTIAAFDEEKYSKSEVTGNEITNQFDNTDINLYKNAGSNSVTYVSRKNWTGTVKFGAAVASDGTQTPVTDSRTTLTTTDGMRTDGARPTLTSATAVQKDESDTNYPTYRDPSQVPDSEVTEQLIDRLAIASDEPDEYGNIVTEILPFDDPDWDILLNQLSWNDTITLLQNGFRKTMGVASIGKPQTVDPNGANGLVGASGLTNTYGGLGTPNKRGLAYEKNDPLRNEKPVLYPSNGLIASTYNKKLAKEMGIIWGEDCLWAGVSGLYGTGINMHRGAHAGRNFEYYGEDGVLAGQIAGQVTVGMKVRGVYSYLKHCFLNDMEAQREGVCTWANEQTIREIYLKPFEIAIKDMKGDTSIMSGFNRLGVEWTGHQGFMNTVLRDEFGMTGFVVSDYYQTGYMSVAKAVLMGNDLPDNPNSINDFNDYGPNKGYAELERAMRASAKRILFTVAQSNAMNGYSTNSRTIVHDDSDWQEPLQAATTTTLVISAIIVSVCSAIVVLGYLGKRGII